MDAKIIIREWTNNEDITEVEKQIIYGLEHGYKVKASNMYSTHNKKQEKYLYHKEFIYVLMTKEVD